MKTIKPLTILFDANPLAASGKSGVGYYTSRLIAALAAEYPNEIVLIGHYYDFLGRKKDLDLPQAANITYCTTRVLPGKFFNGLRRYLRVQVPLEILARCRADVLLFPNFSIGPSLFSKPRVVTIHDLYFTVHPEHINANNIDFLQKFVPRAVAQAELILAVSENTKQTIVATYHEPVEKILVTPIPPPLPVIVAEDVLQQTLHGLGIKKNYLLFVGNLEPRKNLIALIAAYQQLPADLRNNYSLVLAGGKGWNDGGITAAITQAQQAGDDIITPGYVSDAQKFALYQAATIMALPSHDEGFGMQILEAMSYGVPAAVSDIAVFHEVAQGAAAYFDQTNPAAIAACLEQLLATPSLRTELAQKGRHVLTHYKWSTVARDVFTKIREITRG